MNLKDIMTIANSEVVFAILFIGLLLLVVRGIKIHFEQSRIESEKREQYIFKMYEQQMQTMESGMTKQREEYNQLITEQRESFNKREEELLKHLSRNTDQLSNVAETLRDIQRSLGKLEDRVENNFLQVWKELGTKLDRGDVR